MSFSHGKHTRFFVSEYNLTSYVNEVSTTRTASTADTTTMGSNYKTFVNGYVEGEASVSGFYDGSASAVDEVLSAALGSATNKPVTICREAFDAVGDRAELLEAIETKYEVSSSVDDAVGISADFMSNGGVESGVVLHALEAETADASETSHDGLAATTNGAVAHLHITAFSGLDDATVVIEDSANNSAFSTLMSFTTATGLTSERIAVAGTVRRYLRVTTDVTGTGSVTFAVALARR